MDRRESLKSLLLAGMAGGLIVQGCKEYDAESAEAGDVASEPGGGYGRTKEELIRDQQLREATFLTEHELATIAVLCDIVLPADETSGSATDAGVPEFIEFIVKDMPYHQVPMRGGIKWLDNESAKRFEKAFVDCDDQQQIAIVDDIAYPDEVKPAHSQGAKFFDLIRNLTLTGFYTTRIGIDDLGFKGNVPNTWDGVPEEVLAKQGLSYDEEWLAKCVDQSKRDQLPQWDDEGNLIG